jgi:hypothetical protein
MESVAYAFADNGVWIPRIAGWAIMLLGGFLYSIRPRFDFRLKRSSYFLLTSVVGVLVAIGEFMFLADPEAMAGEWFFWLVVANQFVHFVLGYTLGVISVARSLDGYGTRTRWILGFIPLVNLVLFFKPSDKGLSEQPVFLRRASAFAMVLVGIALFGLVREIRADRGDMIVQRFKSSPVGSQARTKLLEARAKARGLKETLENVASGVHIPKKLDKITTLIALNAADDSIEYVYSVDTQLTSLPESFIKLVSVKYCGSDLRPMVNIGATIKATYKTETGVSLGSLSVDKAKCSRL